MKLTKEQKDFLNVVEAYTFIIQANRTYTFAAFAKCIEQVYSMHQPRNQKVYSFLIHNRGTIVKNRLGSSTMKCSSPITFVKE